jgi:hypothetical protein
MNDLCNLVPLFYSHIQDNQQWHPYLIQNRAFYSLNIQLFSTKINSLEENNCVMKSLVSFPLEFDNFMFPPTSEKYASGKLVAHYELLKKVRTLQGSIVKCGITPQEGFTRFAMIKNVLTNNNHKMIAFEKGNLSCVENNAVDSTSEHSIKINAIDALLSQKSLIKKGEHEKIEFVPGDIVDAIPDFLIENPELKIAYLNIDLDDYEATLTTLEFFYPRLVHGGILIFDNYYKKQDEYKAVNDYFRGCILRLNNFSVRKGPHYLVRDYYED